MNKDELTGKLTEEGYEVVRVINVWSNGNKIRRYSGQDESSVWHNPKDGYRKMMAVLIETKDGDVD